MKKRLYLAVVAIFILVPALALGQGQGVMVPGPDALYTVCVDESDRLGLRDERAACHDEARMNFKTNAGIFRPCHANETDTAGFFCTVPCPLDKAIYLCLGVPGNF